MRKAVIVGAGIGGLAAAIALGRRGWNVTVLKRAPELREVGAGISLWPNAVRALDLTDVLRHGIYRLPPLRSYVSGRVALVGGVVRRPSAGSRPASALSRRLLGR